MKKFLLTAMLLTSSIFARESYQYVTVESHVTDPIIQEGIGYRIMSENDLAYDFSITFACLPNQSLMSAHAKTMYYLPKDFYLGIGIKAEHAYRRQYDYYNNINWIYHTNYIAPELTAGKEYTRYFQQINIAYPYYIFKYGMNNKASISYQFGLKY